MGIHMLPVVGDRLAVELFCLVDELFILLRLTHLVITGGKIVIGVGVFWVAVEDLLE